MKLLFTLLFILPLYIQAQSLTDQRFKFPTPINRRTITDAVFKESPNSSSKSLFYLPPGTPLKLIGLYDGSYRARYKDYLGFVHFVYIDGDYDAFTANKYLADGSRSVYDYENEPNDIALYAKIEYTAPLRKEPADKADTLMILPDGAVIKVTHFTKSFWRTEKDGQVGYLAKKLVLRTAKTQQAVEHPPAGSYQPKTTKELFAESDKLIEESKRVLRQTSALHPQSATSHTRPRLATSHYYVRGPRGGCYYVTSSGRKQYVDRSLCN